MSWFPIASSVVLAAGYVFTRTSPSKTDKRPESREPFQDVDRFGQLHATHRRIIKQAIPFAVEYVRKRSRPSDSTAYACVYLTPRCGLDDNFGDSTPYCIIDTFEFYPSDHSISWKSFLDNLKKSITRGFDALQEQQQLYHKFQESGLQGRCDADRIMLYVDEEHSSLEYTSGENWRDMWSLMAAASTFLTRVKADQGVDSVVKIGKIIKREGSSDGWVWEELR